MTIFDYLKTLTTHKKKWEELETTKEFNPYMINKWLSLDYNYTELIAALQRFTINQLTPEQTYKVYYGILPEYLGYNKYIKSKAKKINEELVKYVCEYYTIGNREAKEIIQLCKHQNNVKLLKSILQSFGVTDKQITKILK